MALRERSDASGSDATEVTEQDTGSSAPSLEQMFSIAAEAFRMAAGEEWICRRMAQADTTCALHVTDADYGLTALLDRAPIEVAEEPQDDAEIHISGSEERWLPIFTAEKHLGIALAEGDLEWSGPVRKFLGIFPILRRAYVDVVLDRDPGEDTGGSARQEVAERADSDRSEADEQQPEGSEGSETDEQDTAEQDTGSSAPSLEQMFSIAAEAFRMAAGEEWICRRMAQADTTCALHVTDADYGLTALLDRAPIEVAEEPQDDAEIHISGSEERWLPIFTAEKHLGIALAEGDLEWSGPVRKFLGIFPILRRAYVDVVLDRDPGEDTGGSASERG